MRHRDLSQIMNNPNVSHEPDDNKGPFQGGVTPGTGEENLAGIYSTASRMAPNGIPWEKWRPSENIEDLRPDEASQNAEALARAREIMENKNPPFKRMTPDERDDFIDHFNGTVNSPAEEWQVKRFERSVTEAETEKFSRDKEGRLQVPEGYDAPAGFNGTVIYPSGLQLDYSGLTYRRTYK